MTRHKIPDDKKKLKLGVTINTELIGLLDEHIKDMNINRSKFLEHLIKKDIVNKKLNN